MEKIRRIEEGFATTTNMDTITRTHEATMKWLHDNGVLPTPSPCCGMSMRLHKKATQGDGYHWKCLLCKKTLSIRAGSYFAHHTKIPLLILARVIFFYFANEYNAKEAALALKAEGKYDLHYTTVKIIYEEIREKIMTFYDILWSEQKCGYPHAIEVDESLFTHITLKFGGKTHIPEEMEAIESAEEEKGMGDEEEEEKKINERIKRIQRWAIGFFERGTANVRVFCVENRNADIITKLFSTHVNPGTVVWTDMWRAYNVLGGLGYQHHVVNKTTGFGHGTKTTNRIESIWSQLKVTRQFTRRVYRQSIVMNFCVNFSCIEIAEEIIKTLR
eukprot:TRINITY_DN14262_c0_g1_i1.p1 TRINITY_DN14262_c0_g1~~TRINITY_DN14262_c0_g1_i1.p1  ORF type:complete len:331 (+),score=20.23 TRINITY_DN14262_c0_g1_i1:332-1324(+)